MERERKPVTRPRRQIVEALALGPIEDRSGRATSVLIEKAGLTSSSTSTGQVIKSMEEDGLIIRDLGNGKRTFRIELAPDIEKVDERYAAVLLAVRTQQPEPEPEPVLIDFASVDYDELAHSLLARVADVLGQDNWHLQQRVEQAEALMHEARQRLSDALEECQRHKAKAEREAEEHATTRRLLSDARGKITTLERTIDCMGKDHKKAVSAALDDERRKTLERVMTERPHAPAV